MNTAAQADPDDDATLIDRRFRQLIDGKLVTGAIHQPVVDPATGLVIAVVPIADDVQANDAVAAADRALTRWGVTDIELRAQLIERLIGEVDAIREDLARVIVLEVGKPIAAARDEIECAITSARQVAGMRLQSLVVHDDQDCFVEVRRKPLGVVAAIVPWNSPFSQTIYKSIPALLAGNTVVVKPPPTAPLSAMVLAQLAASIFPAGVLNIIGDGGAVGPLLTSHAKVRTVSFTGSAVACRRVMASSADTLKRVVLQRGGDDAAIVMPDASVAAVVGKIFTWAFANSGQVCVNIKRIFVPSPLYDEFCAKFAALADRTVVGHGLDPRTELGPLQNARQFELALDYLELARRDGTIIAGGEVLPGEGYFVAPTVVRDISDDSAVVREETFGPIRSILRYDDLEEVVARANDTEYGLRASVWGTDLEAAAALADRLRAGTTWVNTHFASEPGVPFGGRNESGLGVEFGHDGLEEFTDTHVIHIARR